MSIKLGDGRDLTDDELSFERLASEIEQLWRSERPARIEPPVRVAAIQRPMKPAVVTRLSPRRPVIPRLRTAPSATRPEPPQAASRPASPAPPLVVSEREPVPRTTSGHASVSESARNTPSTGAEPEQAHPLLLPLCRPDVRIMVGETVAVLQWSTHDDRQILMPIGLESLEELAHAVANALVVALAKDLQR